MHTHMHTCTPTYLWQMRKIAIQPCGGKDVLQLIAAALSMWKSTYSKHTHQRIYIFDSFSVWCECV